MSGSKRNHTVDAIRTLAIVLMVVFHTIFHFKSFGYVDWDIPDGSAWNAFRNVIVGLFVGTVGVSLSLAYGEGIRRRHFWVRCGKIAVCATAVTGMSLVSFPAEWIYFGILHFIALASVCALPLVRWPVVAGALGAVMVGAYLGGIPPYGWPFGLLADHLPTYTRDFVSPSPWLGVVWLGVFLGSTAWLRNDPWGRWKPIERLGGPGRHSLAIYVVHLPLLFLVFSGLERIR